MLKSESLDLSNPLHNSPNSKAKMQIKLIIPAVFHKKRMATVDTTTLHWEGTNLSLRPL